VATCKLNHVDPVACIAEMLQAMLDRYQQSSVEDIMLWRSNAYGMGRYSLWTGDIGLAIFLWDCITERPKFLIVDVF